MDLYAKIAFSFVCVIMCLVGTGIAVRGNIREGLPVSIAYGIGIAFLYWIFYSFCVSLGYGEMLPPIIAVWIANLVFSCVGILWVCPTFCTKERCLIPQERLKTAFD